MVRLVYRPYTHVRRTICTSVSLRASTRVSPGFALRTHSSPSFGSRRLCSHSNLWVEPLGRSVVLRWILCLPRTGGKRLSRFPPRSAGPTFTFVARRGAIPSGPPCRGWGSPQGFPSPERSHTRQTPWSVLQDGSFKTVVPMSSTCFLVVFPPLT